MKKIILALTTMILASSCNQDKMAFVDNSYVINEYQEKKDIEAKYNKKVESYKQRRDSISNALQMEYQAFQLKSKTLSDNEAQSQYQALLQKQQMLQKQFQMEEQSISKQSQTEIDSLIGKVKKFIKDYGKQNNYTLILGTSDATSSVMYGKEEKDISETVLKLLNDNYKKE